MLPFRIWIIFCLVIISDISAQIQDEYSYEDDYDIDAELELWLADIDNENDCVNWGYYWDKANASCGTEWVDNSKSETTTTTSGEILNYTTGDITQTTKFRYCDKPTIYLPKVVFCILGSITVA